MTLYLIRKTPKHLTRAHDVAPDGKHPACGRAALIAGERGWKVVEYEPDYDELCRYCKRKRVKE